MKKAFAFLLAMAMSMSLAFTGCGSTPETPAQDTPATETKDTETKDEAKTDDTAAPDASTTTPVAAQGNSLVWNIGTDSKTFDPQLNSAVDGSCVINNTFSGLLRDKYDGNGIQPEIAEAIPEPVENADGTVTYTFKLKETKWSDGQPLTAKDFVYAWKRAADPATASEYAYIMAPILNATEITAGEKDPSELAVKAVDDLTLEVTLVQPTAYFPELCTFATYMPVREDIISEGDNNTEGTWAKDPAKAVSNGPFYLTSYTMSSEAVFTKNPNYWNADAVKIDKIIGKMIVDESTSLTGFKNGEIDINDKIPPEEIPQLIASGEAVTAPYIGTGFYVINQNTQIEALKDARVRKALSMALDRQAICDNVLRAGQLPATGFMPTGFTDPDGNDFREKAGDYYLKANAQVEEAKALLAEAGYPNGEGIPEIEIMYNTSENLKALSESIQEMWKQLGITCKLNNQEWAVFQDTRYNATYPAVARHGWIGDYQDPQTFLDMFMTGNVQSGCAYSNPAFDEQLKLGMASSGKTRYDAFYQAESILLEDAYVIPIYFYTNTINAAPRVKGWTRASTGQYWFGDVTLDA